MRIGVRTSRQWLENGGDDDFRFLKQIGVDYVDIELGMVAGYDETGCFTREALAALVERFAAAGLRDRARQRAQFPAPGCPHRRAQRGPAARSPLHHG